MKCTNGKANVRRALGSSARKKPRLGLATLRLGARDERFTEVVLEFFIIGYTKGEVLKDWNIYSAGFFSSFLFPLFLSLSFLSLVQFLLCISILGASAGLLIAGSRSFLTMSRGFGAFVGRWLGCSTFSIQGFKQSPASRMSPRPRGPPCETIGC